MMLDAHPELTIPPETHFVPDLIKAAKDGGDTEALLGIVTGSRTWGDFGVSEGELRERFATLEPGDAGGAVRAFFEAYAARIGKPRWGDKTPAYMLAQVRIGRALPEARFIHLIRDGRDVALSQTERALNEQPPRNEQAARWVRRIEKAREQAGKLGGERYMEARYEDLVRDPEPILRRICGFIELDFDPAMLTYYEGAAQRLEEMVGELASDGRQAAQPEGYRIANHAPTTKPPDPSKLDKWRREMSEDDRALYEGEAATMLKELGYEVIR